MYASFFEELAKLAEDKTKEVAKSTMRGFVKARPYAAGAFEAGVPAAVLGNIVGGRRLGTAMGVGAAGLGAANEALKQWEKKHPRKARKVLGKQPAIRKVAAMAGDLRMKGLGGVKRPPFPTEDSKNYSSNLLKNSFKPGQFKTHTQPKHLVRPGPSIQQAATLPGA